ncbi:serine/threonine-protein kinase [Nannocystis punicea]|uniref:Serine/threonine-protein kinase n=1 Tax=Nannocystis punicea TaxID=2995304 RepID=A0ABY7HE73_9BACT|nr:serine/threonine-protein kinase [Nannocystis poenicansa]WAS97397.1 serine/threonine-protein kinase [Nannocystis poenicansa]
MTLDRTTSLSARTLAPGLDLAETAVSGERAIVPGAREVLNPTTDPTVRGRIGRFVLLRELGAGGMGVVHAAFDPELDRRIAVKLLRRDLGPDYKETRFLREAQAMARLSHPNVVQVHDVGVVDGQFFIAMEYVEGRTAGEWAAERPRKWRELLDVYLQAGRGLAAAHAAGVVHRDFKPDNVLIGSDGRARVADFGLARGDDGDGERPGPRTDGLVGARLTAHGAVMGTPAYMSPEQHLGKPAGPASDQFSFCVALHEALCGQRPFAGETLLGLTDNILAGRVSEPPPGLRVPAWLLARLRRGLKTDPADRYPDMDALLRALGRDPAAQRRKWFGAAALGGLAMTLGWLLGPAAAVSVCDAGEARVAEVWSAAQREAVAAALPADVAPKVVAALDDYGARWAAVHRDVCLGHQRGERSSRLLDAGMRCLAERRAALAGAAEVLATGAPGVAREATAVVAKLPPPALCGDPVAMAAEVAPPGDPAIAAAVDEQRARLARARVLADAGELGPAAGELAAVRAEAERLAYAPLVAEAALAAGRTALLAYDLTTARATLDDAYVIGLAARVDAVAAEALARRMWVDGVGLGQPDVALAQRRVAEAMVERTGHRPDLAALLANNLGAVHGARGEPALALASYRAAVAAGDAADYADPVERWSYHANLALVTADPGARAEGFATALAGLGGLLGERHPYVRQLRRMAADHTLDPAAAQAVFAELCPQFVGPGEPYEVCAVCWLALGHAEDDLERPEAAATAMEQAATCLAGPRTGEDEAPTTALANLAGGYAALLRGRPEAALDPLQAAIAGASPLRERPWIAVRIADTQVGLGRALLALDRPAEAIAALEPAIATLSARAADDFASAPHLLLARARTTLADALERTPDASAGRVEELRAAARELYRRAGAGGAARLAALAGARP